MHHLKKFILSLFSLLLFFSPAIGQNENSCVEDYFNECSNGNHSIKLKNICGHEVKVLGAFLVGHKQVRVTETKVPSGSTLEICNCEATKKTLYFKAIKYFSFKNFSNWDKEVVKLGLLVDTYEDIEWCNKCDSTGEVICKYCNGQGEFERGEGMMSCPHCSGTGKKRCLTCSGDGVVGY